MKQIKPEEKARRFKENLCLRCREAGHQAKECKGGATVAAVEEAPVKSGKERA